MKKYTIIVILFVLYGQVSAQGTAATRVRINSDIQGGEKAVYYQELFENAIFNTLKTAYPCLSFVTDDLVRTGLEQQKQVELTGGTGETSLSEFGDNSTRVDFYIYLKSIVTQEGLLTLSAVFRDPREGDDLSSCFLTGDIAETGSGELKNTAKKLADGLKDTEICAYKGSVSIEVKSDLDDTKTDQVNAPCGSGDMVTITTTRKQNSTIKWDLNKYNRRGASGTANYDLKEKMTVEYEYSCYKCKNGDQGPAKVTETNESEARVEGLSKESTSEGQQVNDARVEMVFFENGTYAVLVEATTRKGSLKVTTEKKVEGMCESESEPRDTKDKEIDIPLKVVLGPYPGTSKDISLHQKETKDLSDGPEKTTVEIDFSFTR